MGKEGSLALSRGNCSECSEVLGLESSSQEWRLLRGVLQEVNVGSAPNESEHGYAATR